jgi:hypothetical protein
MVVIWLTEVLAFLNFLILLVTSLALILGILFDVRWAALARDTLEGLFAICIFRVKLLRRFLERVFSFDETRHPRG